MKKFDKFYSGLDEEQRTEFNKYIKENINEYKTQAMIAKGFNYVLMTLLICFMLGQKSNNYIIRNKD